MLRLHDTRDEQRERRGEVKGAARPRRTLDDMLIVQADGEILRAPGALADGDQELVAMAAALVSLGMSTGRWPAWVDMTERGRRVIAVAFDEQIIFMTVDQADAPISRVEFVEQTRQLADG